MQWQVKYVTHSDGQPREDFHKKYSGIHIQVNYLFRYSNKEACFILHVQQMNSNFHSSQSAESSVLYIFRFCTILKTAAAFSNIGLGIPYSTSSLSHPCFSFPCHYLHIHIFFSVLNKAVFTSLLYLPKLLKILSWFSASLLQFSSYFSSSSASAFFPDTLKQWPIFSEVMVFYDNMCSVWRMCNLVLPFFPRQLLSYVLGLHVLDGVWIKRLQHTYAVGRTANCLYFLWKLSVLWICCTLIHKDWFLFSPAAFVFALDPFKKSVNIFEDICPLSG